METDKNSEEGIQIAPDIEATESAYTQAEAAETTANAQTIEEIDPRLFIELGDRVWIESKKYGRIIGRVYFREPDLIRVMPDGITNKLYDYPRIFNDEEDRFDDDLGVEISYVLEKAKFASWVEQQDLQVGQKFDALSADGELVTSYIIQQIDRTQDAINVIDTESRSQTIAFEFAGIPRDASFAIIRITGIERTEADTGRVEGQTEIVVEPGDIIPEPVEGNFSEGEVGVPQSIEGIRAEDIQNQNTQQQPRPPIPVFKFVGFIERTKKQEFIQELRESERIYPDSVQKVDALNDLLGILDRDEQKNPVNQRAIRILMETIFALKQETIARRPDGTISGAKKLSFQSLIDMFRQSHVPLGRTVLDFALKIVTTEYDTLLHKDDAPPEVTEDYFTESIADILEAADKFKKQEGNGTGTSTISPDTTPRYYENMANFLKLLSPIFSKNNSPPTFEPTVDQDFLRRVLPDRITPTLETVTRYSFQDEGEDRETKLNLVDLQTSAYSYRRILGKTWRKDVSPGAPNSKFSLLPAERSHVEHYLLIPLNEGVSYGSTRSGNLAYDMANAITPPTPFFKLLEQYGDPQDIPSANSILVLNPTGGSMGNIQLADYIAAQPLQGYGLGDFGPILVNLGLDKAEYSKDLAGVFDKKIRLAQNSLKSMLGTLRESLLTAQETTQETTEPKHSVAPALKVLTDEGFDRLEEKLRTEPLISDTLSRFSLTNPALKISDLAQIAFLMNTFSDYMLATLGQQATNIAVERFRAIRSIFLRSLNENIRRKLAHESHGEAPKPNKCTHVAKMNTIRKVDDEQERYILLAKLLTKFQGARYENYIECSLCNKHLMCIHERLQIQAFLNPKDREQLTKELYLNFSGGQFHGKFICRNCGQPITEIPYDSNLEFDDQGRPMMGRSVITDAPSQEDTLMAVLGAPVGKTPEITFEDPTESDIYRVIKELCDRLGVYLDLKGMRRVIDRVKAPLLVRESDYRKRFGTLTAAQKRERKIPELTIYRSAQLVLLCGALLLIEIQTHIPDYVIRTAIVGCQAGFTGFPIGEESDKTGINYMACAIASVKKKQSPWTETGFLSVANEVRRAANISDLLMKTVGALMTTDATIKVKLQEKLKYVEFLKQQQQGLRNKDEIPNKFLPSPFNPAGSVDDSVAAVAKPIIAEAASELEKVRAWIIEAHSLAKKTAVLIRGSPYQETTCCLSNIQSPKNFWLAASDLPRLETRTIIPKENTPFLQVHFIPRILTQISVKPQEEFYHRLFLSACFRGQHKGLTHQVGLTNRCRWCGFQFPGNPKDIKVDEEGKLALEEQQIETGSGEFQELLDSIHIAYQAEQQSRIIPSEFDIILKDFGEIEPAPLANWKEVYLETLRALQSLPPNASPEDVAIQLATISSASSEAIEDVHARLKKPAIQELLADIARQNWGNFLSILEQYFLIPANRLVTNFEIEKMRVPLEYGLSFEHSRTIEDNILAPELAIVNRLKGQMVTKTDTAAKNMIEIIRRKLEFFVSQIRQLVNFKNRITLRIIPGTNKTMDYIQKIGIYGIIASLFSEQIGFGEIATTQTINPRILLEFIEMTLIKYGQEKLSFSDQDIKNMIEIRNEKERQTFIKDFDVLDDEMRRVELTKKYLGIGKWAFGASKAVYAYDPEQWDREQVERAKAGISDFPGMGPYDIIAPGTDGQPFTDDGAFGDNGFYDDVNGGYDNDQTAADDA
jgi:hypothetical protein